MKDMKKSEGTKGYTKHSGEIPNTVSFSKRHLYKMVNNQSGHDRKHTHITLKQKKLRRYLKKY